MKRGLLLLLLCLNFGITFTQNSGDATAESVEQLLAALPETDNAIDSINLYLKIGQLKLQADYQDSSVLAIYEEALKSAKRISNPRLIEKSYAVIFRMLFRQSNHDLVLEYLERGLLDTKVFEKDYPDGVGTIYRAFHFYYYYKADYQKMLEYGKRVIELFENTENYKFLAEGYLDSGNAYYYLGDYQNALKNYINTAKLYEAGKNNSYEAYGNISDVYVILEENEKAIEMLQKFLSAATDEGDTRKISIIYYKLAKLAVLIDDNKGGLEYAIKSIEANKKVYPSEYIYACLYASSALSNLERFPEALKYASDATKMLKTAPDPGQEAELENAIGNIHLAMENYSEAENHYKRSIDIASDKGFVHLQMRSSIEVSKIQKQKGNYQAAYKNLENYVTLKDSLFAEEKNKSISELQTKYETEKKELENENLKKTNELIQSRNQQYLIGGLILVGLLLLLGVFFIQLRKIKNQLAVQNEMIAQKNNELTELDKVKSNFFANVSHELRTPLTLILGPLSRVLKSKRINEEEATMLRLMEQNGKSLLNLINEILDLSKLEAKKLTLVEKPTILYLFLQHLFSGFESYAQRQSINLVFEYEADTALQILVDPNKLGKIVNNLLSNACKFTAAQGTVILRIQDLGHSLQFQVADTGKGIHEDDLPNIFDRFYQSKQPGTQAEGGTGIGLALVQEYVNLFGGEISVTSTMGEGSTFTFHIPKRQVLKPLEEDKAIEIANLQNEKKDQDIEQTTQNLEERLVATIASTDAMEQSSITDAAGEKPTILIVEDNYHLRDYIQLTLNEYYHTQTAENGQVALDWLLSLEQSNEYPDLIVSDIMMPVMNGVQFLTHLKESDQFRTIPVIMLTAKADLQDKLQALRIGVDDYMVKPFIEEELIVRIGNLLKNAAARKQYLKEEESSQEEVQQKLEDSVEALQDELIISERDLEWLAKVEEKVIMGYTNFDFTLERLSEMIFLSPRQTRRRLKQITGLNFSQYLREIRLNEARRMLENAEVNSVKHVAYEIGLRDTKYFSQQFKAHFGVLPSSYLEN